MASTRSTSIAVGVLFLVQTVAFIVAEQLIKAALNRPDNLARAAGSADALALGALLAFASGVAVVGIAVLMFPLLKPTSEPLALGYVAERVVELVLQVLFFMAVPLFMITIAVGLHAGTVDASAARTLGPVLTSLHDLAIVVLYLVTSVGGTIFALLLYRSLLVPRPLALLGLVGYPVLSVGCILAMFGRADMQAGIGMLSILPGGLFELILPIWLLARGFGSSEHIRPAVVAALHGGDAVGAVS